MDKFEKLVVDLTALTKRGKSYYVGLKRFSQLEVNELTKRGFIITPHVNSFGDDCLRIKRP